MPTPDCYTSALHAGIPLVILTWLGQISICIIYEMWKYYVGRPQKYSPVQQEVQEKQTKLKFNNSEDLKKSVPLVDEQHTPSLAPNYSHESSDSSSSEHSPEVSPTLNNTSQVSGPTVQEPPTIPTISSHVSVQQELAGRNLNITGIQENMMALAPLAKQRVEESNLPENQKQLLLGIMDAMSSMTTTKPDTINIDQANIFSTLANSLSQHSESNNILDD